MPQPIILAVGDDIAALQVLERELRNRYGSDYEILCERAPATALGKLADLQTTGGQVALLFADLWLAAMTGVEFLAQAHALHPHAKRILVTTTRWNDRSAGEVLRQAMALGQIDSFLFYPQAVRDEYFHRTITEALEDWTGLQQPWSIVHIVGDPWTPRAHAIRDLLQRNNVPYDFYDRHSEAGQLLLKQVQHTDGPFPVLIFASGSVLADPSTAAIAEALGEHTRPEDQRYDVVIIGAGPAGLSAAVYGASEGLRTLVIEREAMGGQAGTSSLIRNYLGFPWGISGGKLAYRAFMQARLFGAAFLFAQQVTGLRADGQERIITLADGSETRSRAVVLAMGVAYRRLGIPRLEALLGAGVFYGAAVTEAQAMQGQAVFVAGAGNSAGQAALHLAKYAAQVTLLVRGHSLSTSMSDYLVQEITASDNITVRLNTQIIDGRGAHRLHNLVLQNTVSGATETVPAAALFVLIGTQPHTRWLPPTITCDAQGFILTGNALLRTRSPAIDWALDRPPLVFETSLPGVFAIGDVRHRSVKRVASAVGEGSIAVQLVHEYLGEH